ncbi:MAG TPA: HAMP domain-containing sensor histidine kinase [Ensifer sp.]|jgi:signal transduction histidine kinase|uniref:sensor histidine kinase n=1 Tax=Ensifer sp. TaxID=1872086 RepID=UPI002E131ACF|nr:HAMP domain-containing sensor histidine kinase [Ensifer sp.]
MMKRRRSIAFPVASILILGMALIMVISTVLTIAGFVLTDTQGRQKLALESVAGLLQKGAGYDHEGKLSVQVNGVISERILGIFEAQTDFWYLFSDGTQSITHGTVPESVRSIVSALPREVFASDFYYTNDLKRYLGLRKLDQNNPDRVVVIGGVSLTNTQTILLALWGTEGLYPLLSAVLAATATIAVVAVKRTIATPVGRVVNSAEQIDGLPGGRRISDHDTPIELKPMVAAFNTALSRIDHAFEAQRNFLASASHELRTPLTKLRLKLDLVQDPGVRDVLVRDTARLASIVTTSLQLARLSGQSLTFAAIDLAAMTRTIVAEHVPSAMKQGMEIELKAPEERVAISGSEPAIRVALDNLIVNAMRHAQGTEMLTVEVLEARTVRVTDHGPGIPAAERENMLRPFVRGNTAADGTGMGLAIVAQIMTAHGGSVDLADAPGGGLVVSLAFPSVRADRP